VRIDAELEAEKFESQLVLQVHDEVILEAIASEEVAVEKLVREAMCSAAELSVTLEVNLAWGDTWASAKS
jgi:DNA polymerase-1